MTYDEAARLINLLKQIINLDSFSIPRQGEKDTIDMVSVYSEKDKFIVDFNRSGRIRKDKYTLQLKFENNT